jgi:hypothetical protein
VAGVIEGDEAVNEAEDKRRRASPSELLKEPEGFLYRTDLYALGLHRRAVDSAFRNCPNIVMPDYRRTMIQVKAYLAFLDGSTYCPRCADRVRPG